MEPTDKVLHESVGCLDSRHKAEHEGYEYTRRYFVRRGEARQCVVSVYEIPPGKSAYPYHYHVKDEETFYIISGEGTLRTPGASAPSGPGSCCSSRRGRAGPIS